MAAVTTLLLCLVVGSDGGVVLVPSGRFAPLFGLDTGQRDFPVRAFSVSVRPVSVAEFDVFLRAQPQWRRENVSPAVADERYLASWESFRVDGPVVDVSYFGARAFCEWRGGRLPTSLEWEYLAAADETRRDASRDPAFVRRILEWYARPNRAAGLTEPGSPANVYGVEALHALVWEWTDDFNSVFVSGDNRQDGDRNSRLMCGTGATGSARREDYAAFMRYALRSSLTARMALPHLGFRCAFDDPSKQKRRSP